MAGYTESPDKQKSISRAVALNDSCQLWGGIFKFSNAIDAEMKQSIEQGVLDTAGLFYDWLINIPESVEVNTLGKKIADEVIK